MRDATRRARVERRRATLPEGTTHATIGRWVLHRITCAAVTRNWGAVDPGRVTYYDEAAATDLVRDYYDPTLDGYTGCLTLCKRCKPTTTI